VSRGREQHVAAAAEIPPAHELFNIRDLAARHQHILSETRIRWAIRNRGSNGLAAVAAVFESKSGQFLVREPTFLRWWLGLSGVHKPRARRTPSES
jgi:hypothetical protein